MGWQKGGLWLAKLEIWGQGPYFTTLVAVKHKLQGRCEVFATDSQLGGMDGQILLQ